MDPSPSSSNPRPPVSSFPFPWNRRAGRERQRTGPIAPSVSRAGGRGGLRAGRRPAPRRRKGLASDGDQQRAISSGRPPHHSESSRSSHSTRFTVSDHAAPGEPKLFHDTVRTPNGTLLSSGIPKTSFSWVSDDDDDYDEDDTPHDDDVDCHDESDGHGDKQRRRRRRRRRR